MRAVIEKHIKPKSFLIFDGWKSSKSAVEQLGYRHAPPVIHSKGWRDSATGYHSNDIESENSRLKLWIRARYSHLKMSTTSIIRDDEAMPEEMDEELLDVYEYVFYVNVGSDIPSIMQAIAEIGGGKQAKYLVK